MNTGAEAPALAPSPARRVVARARGLPATMAELEEVRRECRALVNRSASLSGIAAVVPLPGVDVGADVTLFMQLLPNINRRFGLSPEQVNALDARTKELVFLGATSVGSQVVARLVTVDVATALLRRIGVRVAAKSAARWVPIVGQAAAAGISFAAMRLVGNRHVEDCFAVARAVLTASGPVVDLPPAPAALASTARGIVE